jgi:adenylate cyclase
VSKGLDVRGVVDWLGRGAPGHGGDDVISALGPKLLESGIRLARMAAFVRTLHPFILGRRIVWKRGVDSVEVSHAPFDLTASPEYLNSPSGRVTTSGEEHRWRLEGDLPLEYSSLETQREAGMTDYLALPMRFLSGEAHAMVYSTDAKGGFTDEEIDALRQVTYPLARVAEILALTRTAANLLDAYVGHHAGQSILAGHVRRGETELIRCVIWFSDLRGFTTLSAKRHPASTVELLNRLFDCQVPAVERHGGEVLKFIGDGMLAIFPVDDAHNVKDVTRDALAAAREAFLALDSWNAERAAGGEDPVGFGLALHYGEVGYGNIGGAGRLDFTCIGPAVNLASRVEGLTGKLGKRMLLTEAIAEVAEARTRRLGAFEVKGVDAAPVVYELIDE